MAAGPQIAARALLRAVPLVMCVIRDEMRARRAPRMSVPQFRALLYVGRHGGASLSDVAAHQGVALPSMSRLVDGLVARRLIARRGDARDRRRVTLRLTAPGRTQIRKAHRLTETALASHMARLCAHERAQIVRTLSLLYRLFSATAPVRGCPTRARSPRRRQI